MIGRHHNRAVPVVARQHHQIVIQMQRFGGDGEIGIAFDTASAICVGEP
jgi:hypothetical protein